MAQEQVLHSCGIAVDGEPVYENAISEREIFCKIFLSIPLNLLFPFPRAKRDHFYFEIKLVRSFEFRSSDQIQIGFSILLE